MKSTYIYIYIYINIYNITCVIEHDCMRKRTNILGTYEIGLVAKSEMGVWPGTPISCTFRMQHSPKEHDEIELCDFDNRFTTPISFFPSIQYIHVIRF